MDHNQSNVTQSDEQIKPHKKQTGKMHSTSSEQIKPHKKQDTR
jgi:hypothetical protein